MDFLHYLCTYNIRHAIHRTSIPVRAFCKGSSFTKDNTLLRPLNDAHLRSFLFFTG